MSSGKSGESLSWSFGLINSARKYLTAETFGSKIVCAASLMKKKQIFFLEQDEGSEHVFIRSHLDKYLTVDGDGKFTCDVAEKGDEQAMIIEPQPDGRWAIKSKKYGWYTGGTGENLTAFTKEITEDRLWTVHLAMHPQINLYNVMRKAYVHLSPEGNCFNTDELIPWGEDATITVVFSGGTYGLQACNGSFLNEDGTLTPTETANSHFILEFKGGMVSFKGHSNGKYLTALGGKGALKASKSSITRDEQFRMEDSFPQITLKGVSDKYVSLKQGIECACTAAKVTDEEIFQIEPLGVESFSDHSCQFAIKGNTKKYFGLVENSVQAKFDNSQDPATHFTIEWMEDKIAIKASNGKYVEQLNNKYLSAKADAVSDHTLYTWELTNRPRLVLRGEYGFMGTLPSGLLECNKSEATVYDMSVKEGKCAISAGPKFLKVHSNGISANGESAEPYFLEIYDNSKLAVKHDGKYFQSSQNGALTLTGTKLDKYTLFEY